jgi:hypothetical protein
MTNFFNENDHRETLDQIIHTVIDSAPDVKDRKIAILKRPSETALQVALDSEYVELYREYYDKLINLGFNLDSLPKHDAPSTSI